MGVEKGQIDHWLEKETLQKKVINRQQLLQAGQKRWEVSYQSRPFAIKLKPTPKKMVELIIRGPAENNYHLLPIGWQLPAENQDEERSELLFALMTPSLTQFKNKEVMQTWAIINIGTDIPTALFTPTKILPSKEYLKSKKLELITYRSAFLSMLNYEPQKIWENFAEKANGDLPLFAVSAINKAIKDFNTTEAKFQQKKEPLKLHH